tara:strand:- start:1 stop:189 length:189 start_codon:yes stop_codon:yes gene_type:complete
MTVNLARNWLTKSKEQQVSYKENKPQLLSTLVNYTHRVVINQHVTFLNGAAEIKLTALKLHH